jgi:hypothetical protein
MEHLRDLTKSKGRKNFYILSSVVFALAVLVLFMSIFISKWSVLEKKEISTSLGIGNKTGINVSKDSISLGTLSVGNAAFRNDMILTNNYNFPIYVKFDLDGNIEPFLIFDKYVFLEPGESKNVSISTIQISDESYGFYHGKFTLVFKRDFKHNNS